MDRGTEPWWRSKWRRRRKSLEMFQVAGKSGALSQPDVTITPAAISSINQSLDGFVRIGIRWSRKPLRSALVVIRPSLVGRNSTGFLVKFAANQLSASGSPVPSVVINPNRKASNLR